MPEAVQTGREIRTFILNFVMPDSDPASPAHIRDGRSRVKRGMTPFLDSLTGAIASSDSAGVFLPDCIL